MFNFFKKWMGKRAESKARAKLVKDAQSGIANPLELALIIHAKEPSKESFARLILVLPKSEAYVLSAGEERLANVAVWNHEQGAFLVLFTSRELAQAAAQGQHNRVQCVSVLELLFGYQDLGLIFNPGSPLITGLLTVPMLETVRKVLEDSSMDEEGCSGVRVGNCYTIWNSEAFRVVRVLKTDKIGVHLRLYAGSWPERPDVVNPEQLLASNGEARGIGHMPFKRQTFLGMGPKAISVELPPLCEDDFDGYRLWEEGKGGYFGT